MLKSSRPPSDVLPRRCGDGADRAEVGIPPDYRCQDSYTVADLEQVKVLADPLRLRILEAFCEERTTKQVADRLGEKPTKLYHHVDLLDRLGLIELMRTKKNRGTLEKYYLAVAKTFRVESAVFSAADTGPSPKAESLRRWSRTCSRPRLPRCAC